MKMKMKMKSTKIAVPAVLLLWGLGGGGGLALGASPALKAQARALLEKNKQAIVTVKLVVTTRTIFGGREGNKSESKSEIAGTVLNASGLTVVSNFASDPSAAMRQAMHSMGGAGGMQFKMESDITDSKIVLADGTEIPARFVLKDKDLDLAFIKPKEKPKKPFAYVHFAPAPDPKVLADIVTIGRLSRAVKRVNSLALGYIQAVVKKPRTLYICDLLSGYTSMGCPVFNAKGETLGLSVVKMNPARGAMGLLGGMQPVVLPAADLLEIAKQAAAKVKEKTPPKKGAGKKK